MSWNDFYQRRDILEAAVRQAGHHPSEPLSLDEIPGATKYFATEEELLVALRYKWNQVFGGYLRAEMADPDYADQDLPLDRVDAVTRAWNRATAEHEALRAVLDAALERCPALLPSHEAELRTLALTAGLADGNEPAAEITKVGAAFATLLRHGRQAKPARRRSPMGHLLRLLAPSA
ncbi:hypothetical protein [Amycolatopsis orientalis]|uniref:hypothetical protein n=1 Tax=Amycolatopsis orientalis TaxID=31958 RepID=UPI00041BBECE|nr:hypothetical protein [Amycolatopsis orientalis]